MKHVPFFGLVLLAACQPRYDHLEMRLAAGTEDGGLPRLANDGIVLAADRVAAVRVEPIANGVLEYEDFHLIGLEVDNRSIVQVYGGPELDTFVFVPQLTGHTELQVSIRGEHVDSIPLEVVAR